MLPPNTKQFSAHNSNSHTPKTVSDIIAGFDDRPPKDEPQFTVNHKHISPAGKNWFLLIFLICQHDEAAGKKEKWKQHNITFSRLGVTRFWEK